MISMKATAIPDVREYFERLPQVAEQAMVFAINDVVSKKGMTLLRKTARSQINFPKGYLEKEGRLVVYQKALRGRPEATIRARDRATSLARFRTPGQQPGTKLRGGVRLQVKPGATVTMKKAFLLRLRNNNVGLAMRLRPGESPDNTSGAVQMGVNFPNIWLFYGPSVDQVMSDVYDEKKFDIATMISKEFLRQFNRLARSALNG